MPGFVRVQPAFMAELHALEYDLISRLSVGETPSAKKILTRLYKKYSFTVKYEDYKKYKIGEVDTLPKPSSADEFERLPYNTILKALCKGREMQKDVNETIHQIKSRLASGEDHNPKLTLGFRFHPATVIQERADLQMEKWEEDLMLFEQRFVYGSSFFRTGWGNQLMNEIPYNWHHLKEQSIIDGSQQVQQPGRGDRLSQQHRTGCVSFHQRYQHETCQLHAPENIDSVLLGGGQHGRGQHGRG